MCSVGLDVYVPHTDTHRHTLPLTSNASPSQPAKLVHAHELVTKSGLETLPAQRGGRGTVRQRECMLACTGHVFIPPLLSTPLVGAWVWVPVCVREREINKRRERVIVRACNIKTL